MNGSGDPMDTDLVRVPDSAATGEETIVTVDSSGGSVHADDTNPLIFDIDGRECVDEGICFIIWQRQVSGAYQIVFDIYRPTS